MEATCFDPDPLSELDHESRCKLAVHLGHELLVFIGEMLESPDPRSFSVWCAHLAAYLPVADSIMNRLRDDWTRPRPQRLPGYDIKGSSVLDAIYLLAHRILAWVKFAHEPDGFISPTAPHGPATSTMDCILRQNKFTTNDADWELIRLFLQRHNPPLPTLEMHARLRIEASQLLPRQERAHDFADETDVMIALAAHASLLAEEEGQHRVASPFFGTRETASIKCRVYREAKRLLPPDWSQMGKSERLLALRKGDGNLLLANPKLRHNIEPPTGEEPDTPFIVTNRDTTEAAPNSGREVSGAAQQREQEYLDAPASQPDGLYAAEKVMRWKGNECKLGPVGLPLVRALWRRGTGHVELGFREARLEAWEGVAEDEAIAKTVRRIEEKLVSAGITVHLVASKSTCTISADFGGVAPALPLTPDDTPARGAA